MNTEADHELLDVEAAARYLGVKPAMIYRLVNEGQLTARRFPLRVRVRDLESCVERCRITPGTLAHLDPNAAKRARPDREVPLTRQGKPDRRYGRRYPPAAGHASTGPRPDATLTPLE